MQRLKRIEILLGFIDYSIIRSNMRIIHLSHTKGKSSVSDRRIPLRSKASDARIAAGSPVMVPAILLQRKLVLLGTGSGGCE